ncbi:MAG: MFS transporter [Candidatus Merdivicinus sp.]
MTHQTQKKHWIGTFYILTLLLYSMTTLYNSVMPLYLKDFSPSLRGVLLSAGPIVSSVAPLFWGSLADRTNSKKWILAAVCFGASLVFPFIFQQNAFWPILFLMGFTTFFSSSFGSLSDTITLSYCTQNGFSYGPIRIMGTVGYGIFAAISGIIMDQNKKLLPWIYFILGVVTITVIFFLPTSGQHQTTQPVARRKLSFSDIRVLFREVPLLPCFMLLIFLTHFPLNYFYNFYSAFFVEELHFPERMWGIIILATVSGEIPFFIWYDKLLKRVKIRTLFFLSTILGIARFTSFALVSNLAAIILTAVCTGMLTTIVIYSITWYINTRLPENKRATAQGAIYCTCSITSVTAGFIGGTATGWIGVRGMLFFCIFLSLAALTLVTVLSRKGKLNF